jgi:hypothetical protein
LWIAQSNRLSLITVLGFQGDRIETLELRLEHVVQHSDFVRQRTELGAGLGVHDRLPRMFAMDELWKPAQEGGPHDPVAARFSSCSISSAQSSVSRIGASVRGEKGAIAYRLRRDRPPSVAGRVSRR